MHTVKSTVNRGSRFRGTTWLTLRMYTSRSSTRWVDKLLRRNAACAWSRTASRMASISRGSDTNLCRVHASAWTAWAWSLASAAHVHAPAQSTAQVQAPSSTASSAAPAPKAREDASRRTPKSGCCPSTCSASPRGGRRKLRQPASSVAGAVLRASTAGGRKAALTPSPWRRRSSTALAR